MKLVSSDVLQGLLDLLYNVILDFLGQDSWAHGQQLGGNEFEASLPCRLIPGGDLLEQSGDGALGVQFNDGQERVVDLLQFSGIVEDQQLGQSVAHSDGGVSVSLTEFRKILDGLAADLKERWVFNLSGTSKRKNAIRYYIASKVDKNVNLSWYTILILRQLCHTTFDNRFLRI